MERTRYLHKVIEKQVPESRRREMLQHEYYSTYLELVQFPHQTLNFQNDPEFIRADARMARYITWLPADPIDKKTKKPVRDPKWAEQKTEHVTRFKNESLFLLGPVDFLGRDSLRVYQTINILSDKGIDTISDLARVSDKNYSGVFGQFSEFVPGLSRPHPTQRDLAWAMKKLAEAKVKFDQRMSSEK